MSADVDRRTFVRYVAVAVASVVAGQAAHAEVARLAAAASEIAPSALTERLASYAVPASDSVSIDARNELAIVRYDGRVYAFSLRCPHRGTRLEWRPSEGCMYCPKHKARFARDGSHQSGRQSRDLDRFALSRDGQNVAVHLDTVLRADTDAEAWRAAVMIIT